MADYSQELNLVKSLRDLGAVQVSVGDLHVRFATPSLPPSAIEEDIPELSEEEAQKEWERMQYWSS